MTRQLIDHVTNYEASQMGAKTEMQRGDRSQKTLSDKLRDAAACGGREFDERGAEFRALADELTAQSRARN